MSYRAMRWQPLSVLVEAYEAAGEALASGRVGLGDILEFADYVEALERELQDRGVIRDPVAEIKRAAGSEMLPKVAIRGHGDGGGAES